MAGGKGNKLRKANADSKKRCPPKKAGKSVAECPKKSKKKNKVVFVKRTRRFAPSVDDCEIKWRLVRKVPGSALVLLEIHDNQGKLVYHNEHLNLDAADRGVFKWTGKSNAGGWATPAQSPFEISLSIVKDSAKPKKKSVKVEVKQIDLWVDETDNKLFMNDPVRKVGVVATVSLKKTNGAGAVTAVPIPVKYTHSDPGTANTTKVNSFKYDSAGKWLGKASDASATHYESHADSPATSADGFKTNCEVKTITASGADQGKAKVYFKPSGVGGDNFRIKAAVLRSDGTSEIESKQSPTLTVWRAVEFKNIREMVGQTQVSTNGTTGVIAPVFNPAFVKYTAGAATAIPANKSVKYIGLWKDTATPQRSWTTLQAKKPDETPTADEIAKATGPALTPAAGLLQGVARAAIIVKAQKWADRIDAVFHAGMRKWITDAGIPRDALVSIQYYNPKYSHGGGDFQTNEWKLGGASTPAWLRVGAFKKSGGGYYYTNLDPDGLWINWGGLSHGSGKVSVPKGNSAAITKQVVRHEAGHATKYQFKRDVFGPSLDHSASNAGIMFRTTAGGTTFTTREKKILRGIKP